MFYHKTFVEMFRTSLHVEQNTKRDHTISANSVVCISMWLYAAWVFCQNFCQHLTCSSVVTPSLIRGHAEPEFSNGLESDSNPYF